MKILPFLALALLAAPARGQGAASPDVAAVLALARQSALAPDPEADAARFLALMDRLGSSPAPADGDPSPEAEVARVARAAAPALAAELEQRYAMTFDSRRQSSSAYHPVAEHLNGRYRLAWEWLLLRSRFVRGAPGYNFRALEALGRIHDEASISLIVRLCEEDAEAYHLGFTDKGHLDLLGNDRILETYVAELASFRSVRGLEAIVACTQAIERAQDGEPTQPGEGVDVGRILRSALRPKYADPRPEWVDAEAEYRAEPAHREGARLLDRLLVEPPHGPHHTERPPRKTPPSP